VSRALGYAENGTDWSTTQGGPALLQHWRLTRDAWLPRRRDDIELHGVEAGRRALGL
jgi:hypothetical protein